MPTLAGGHKVKRARIETSILGVGDPEVGIAFQASFLRDALRGGYLLR
jgi:hypothetical protein